MGALSDALNIADYIAGTPADRAAYLAELAALEPLNGVFAVPWYGTKTAAGHLVDRRRVRDNWGDRPLSTPTRRAIMRELACGHTVPL